MREREIESYLIERVKALGGESIKLTGVNGIPDRLVLFRDHRPIFVEVKAPFKKPRPLQIVQMNKIASLGCVASIVDTKEAVDELFKKEGLF